MDVTPKIAHLICSLPVAVKTREKKILGQVQVVKIVLTCSRHRNLQNIQIRILQIFCYDFFAFLNPNPIFFSITRLKLFVAVIKKIKTKIWRI